MGNSWTAVTPDISRRNGHDLWLEEAANLRWHPLSQEWLQLGKLAQDLPPYSTVYWHYKCQASGVIVSSWWALYMDKCGWGELEKVYPQMMRKIRFERSAKPSNKRGAGGFVLVARWVIERSNAWMEACKVWLRTLSELYLMQRLDQSLLSGSCKRLAVPSWDLKWVLYSSSYLVLFRPLFAQETKGELEDIWTLPGWNTGDSKQLSYCGGYALHFRATIWSTQVIE